MSSCERINQLFTAVLSRYDGDQLSSMGGISLTPRDDGKFPFKSLDERWKSLTFRKDEWGRKDGLDAFNYRTREFTVAMSAFMHHLKNVPDVEGWMNDEKNESSLLREWYDFVILGEDVEDDLPSRTFVGYEDFELDALKASGCSDCVPLIGSAIDEGLPLHDVFVTFLLGATGYLIQEGVYGTK
jgi:hypothetical protein